MTNVNVMIQERILLLMKSLGLNPAQFADEIGIQRSSISHIISGRNNPSLDIITKILNRFSDIDSNWLVLGKGSLVAKSEEISSKDKNIEFSKPSTISSEQFSNTLFDDNQNDNLLKEENHTIEDLQRKIEFLERKSSGNENKTEFKNNPINKVQVEKNDELVNKLEVEKTSSINNIIDSSINLSKHDNNKRIVKLIVFYSDNTFEELTKN